MLTAFKGYIVTAIHCYVNPYLLYMVLDWGSLMDSNNPLYIVHLSGCLDRNSPELSSSLSL